VILEDGQAWAATVRPTAELLIDNKAGDTRRSFSIQFSNPGREGTISVGLDGQSLGRIRVAHGDGNLVLPVHLTKKKQVLSLAWDGPPIAIDGKVYGQEGNMNTYLLFTRPQFTR